MDGKMVTPDKERTGQSPPNSGPQYFANILNNSRVVFLEFEGHKYQCDIAEMRLGEYLLLRVSKPDQGLVNVPLKFDFCKLRVFTVQGAVYIFPSKLLQKKLPLVVMSFPDREEEGFIRGSVRLFVRQTTPIVVKRRDNVLVARDRTGVGIITDLSEGGCNLITRLEVAKGDKIHIFLNVSLEKEPRNIELTCIVRREGVTADGQGEFGLEFSGLPEETHAEVRFFLAQHPASGPEKN